MLKQLRASAPFLHSSRTKDTPICPQNSDDWADSIVAMEKVKNDRSRREGLLHHRLSHEIRSRRNGYIESFNVRLRDELFNGEIFYTLREAQIIIESWRPLQHG